MIPFAVKQVWFWLALTGLVQCWVTLIYLGRNIGGLWGRLYYCVFVTLLEGIFCIGMVWHMDPSRMPRPFCIAQVISFSLGSFALTGLCASFAIACARVVFRPRTVNTGRAVLAWHPRYIPLLVFFPVAACVTHATLVITLDAVQPSLSDDLHCEVTNPMWMRFVGYSGVPLIVSIPFLALSIFTAFRLYQIKRIHSTRSTCAFDDREADEDEAGYGPTSMRSYNLGEPNTRSTFNLNAFLPYPLKARFKNPIPISSSPEGALDKDPGDFPLHKHPFPVIDPRTGNVYSPSIEERTATPFTIPEISFGAAHTHTQFHRHLEPNITNHPRTLSPHDRSTPDSGASTTIPVFIATPILPLSRASTIAIDNNARLTPSSEAGDAQVGVAITTGDSPSPRVSTEVDHVSDEGAAVGLAVTTDEPELRTLTPTQRLRTPSPLKYEIDEISASPDNHLAQDSLQPPDSALQRSTPDVIGDRARSPEYIIHAVSSATQIHHPYHPARQTTPSPNHLFPQHQQSYFVSSGTVYSTAFTFTDGEDRNLLPASPATASFLPSPTTPNENSIDLAFELGLGYRVRKNQGGDRNRDDIKATKDAEWKAHEEQTVRDQRDHLDGYNNSTAAMPTSAVLEQRRKNPQQEIRSGRGLKLGNIIWRMILFQIAFFTIQILACLSSLLDVARHTITPFGTQHVALILAAWGPLWVFAPVPNFRRFRKRSQ